MLQRGVMKVLILGLVCSWLSGTLLADAGATYDIARIEVNGLKRTERQVVLTELNFDEGERVSQQQIDDGIHSLKKTQLFSKIDHSLQSDGAKHRLVLDLEERWTTIPILKFSQGGGVSQLILGVFDPNIAGKYLEAGGQYERLGDADSGVVWLRDRRLFGTRFYLDLQLWNSSRLRTKYLTEPEDAEVLTAFVHNRRRIFAGLSYEFSRNLSAGVFIDRHDDRFSDDLLSDKLSDERLITDLPPDTDYLFWGLMASWSALELEGHELDGYNLNAEYRMGEEADGVAKDFYQALITGTAYKRIPAAGLNLALRMELGGTDTETLQYWNYLGGLDKIRGFSDNRFAGRYYWLVNGEVRYTAWQRSWVILQPIAFYDAVGAHEQSDELGSVTGASVGAGLRFIAPKIYRLVARIDFASPIVRDDDNAVSFGVQQFF